jgi:hypothetical protein
MIVTTTGCKFSCWQYNGTSTNLPHSSLTTPAAPAARCRGSCGTASRPNRRHHCRRPRSARHVGRRTPARGRSPAPRRARSQPASPPTSQSPRTTTRLAAAARRKTLPPHRPRHARHGIVTLLPSRRHPCPCTRRTKEGARTRERRGPSKRLVRCVVSVSL